MGMHTLYQPIQRRHFPVLVKSNHVPPLPAFAIFAKEPFLHDHIRIQPQISSPLEQPILSPVCVELVVVAVALSCVLVERFTVRRGSKEGGTNLFDAGCFASVGSVGFYGWRAVLIKELDTLGFGRVVPDVYCYCLCDCVRL